MKAAPPKAIGKMPCLCCGEQITVKQSESGTVSVSCPDCDFSGYGKAGTDAQRKILGRVTYRTTPAAPSAPAPSMAQAAAKPAATKAPARAAAPATTQATPAAAPSRATFFG